MEDLLIASTPAHHVLGVLARPGLKNSPVELSRTIWTSGKLSWRGAILDNGCGGGSDDNLQGGVQGKPMS